MIASLLVAACIAAPRWMGQASPGNPSLGEIDYTLDLRPEALTLQSALRERAISWQSKYHLPGVWAAYLDRGVPKACVAVGTRRDGGRMPASVEDKLAIGSVSKPITAALIACFVAEGAVSWSTRVSDVFPEMVRDHPSSPLGRATIANLLTHRAGLPSHLEDYNTGQLGAREWRLSVLDRMLKGDKCTEPGRENSYSNLGPTIAVAIVEKLTIRTYEQWLAENEGEALGLRGLKMLDPRSVSATDVYPHYVRGDKVSLGSVDGNAYLRFDPAGGIQASLPELCRFARFCSRTRDVLGAPVARDVASTAQGGAFTLGGWSKESDGWLQHAGATGRGEICIVWIKPDVGRALIFYTNAAPDRDLIGEVGIDIRRMLGTSSNGNSERR